MAGLANVPASSSDGIAWSGPACPTCGHELDAEAVATESSIVVVMVCPDHGPVTAGGPFEVDGTDR